MMRITMITFFNNKDCVVIGEWDIYEVAERGQS